MSEHDPILGRRITRRTMLQGTALAGVGAFLAACGTSGQSSAPTSAPSAAPSDGAPSEMPTASDVLNFANWPLYIDQDEGNPPKSPTLEQFTEKYGTKVNYVEAVNDGLFFGTIQPPSGPARTPAGTSSSDRLDGRTPHHHGWVETIGGQHAQLSGQPPGRLQGVAWDPTPTWAPWQSGMITWASTKTRAPTSLDAFWTDDPRWKAEVQFLTEMRTRLASPASPQVRARATRARPTRRLPRSRQQSATDRQNFLAAASKRPREGRPSRTAWSGDIIQAALEKETLRFVIPDEGRTLWTDNMQIPKEPPTSTRPSW
jgi:spermidine/putrescine transport system substrate-binding protein